MLRGVSSVVANRGRGARGKPDPVQPVHGGVYWVDDARVTMPPWLPARRLKTPRPVIVVSGSTFNFDDSWQFVLVVPTSTEPEMVSRFCVDLRPAESGMSRQTWARVPAIQPLEKTDLLDRCGLLQPMLMRAVIAQLVRYLELA